MNAIDLRENGWPCPTGEEMGRIDRDAIERRGLPGRLLMENAGRAVAQAVRELVPGARRPLVVCGGGNNGGDGFVIARVLREWDEAYAPVVLALGDPSRRSEEARTNFELLMTSGVEVVVANGQKEIDLLLARTDLVVDAVFGVGLRRPVEGEAAEILAALGASALPVLAVDLPSGLSSETGRALGSAARADFVVTLGLPKLGLAVEPHDAEIWVADIGLPRVSRTEIDIHQHVWTREAAARRLPARPASAHKGTFGHVFVVGGSEGKTGAAVLAAEGALLSGAGLVTAATPRTLSVIYEIKLTEAMTLAYEDGGAAQLVESAVPLLLREAGTRDVAVVGPGLGAVESVAAAVRALLGGLAKPAVVDADGLNAFAGHAAELGSSAPRVLTPHPGELARLLGCSTAEIGDDRVGAARTLAEQTGAVTLLKGARTVVAAPDGEVLINPTGSPGLASGGSGDVLSGVVGALLAQGVEPFEAAALAAYVHGLAGERLGAIARAGAVAAALPEVIAELRETEGDDGSILRRFL